MRAAHWRMGPCWVRTDGRSVLRERLCSRLAGGRVLPYSPIVGVMRSIIGCVLIADELRIDEVMKKML